jgi:hypothetical protein
MRMAQIGIQYFVCTSMFKFFVLCINYLNNNHTIFDKKSYFYFLKTCLIICVIYKFSFLTNIFR